MRQSLAGILPAWTRSHGQQQQPVHGRLLPSVQHNIWVTSNSLGESWHQTCAWPCIPDQLDAWLACTSCTLLFETHHGVIVLTMMLQCGGLGIAISITRVILSELRPSSCRVYLLPQIDVLWMVGNAPVNCSHQQLCAHSNKLWSAHCSVLGDPLQLHHSLHPQFSTEDAGTVPAHSLREVENTAV